MPLFKIRLVDRSVESVINRLMTIPEENRIAAAKIYATYRQPFLDTIPGALTKQLLIRDENVQVLHSFDSVTHPKDY